MINLLTWILIVAIGSWIVLGMLFLGYPTVQRIKYRRDEIGWVMAVPIYVALFFGIIADTFFNLLWGSIIFRELPQEFMFTDRLKRHWRGDDQEQKKRAEPWVKRVNLIDPGHV